MGKGEASGAQGPPDEARAGGQTGGGGSGPLGPELGGFLAGELLPRLVEQATRFGGELSRWTAVLSRDRLQPQSDPPLELAALEAEHAVLEARFHRAGYWLAVVSDALGAPLGNRRLERKALDGLEPLLEEALDGPPFVHEPPFAWPQLASGQGQSTEAPLALLAALLVAQRAQGPATRRRGIGLRPSGQGYQLEIRLENPPAAEGARLLEELKARLPALIPGALLKLELPSPSGCDGGAGSLVRLHLPPGWLVP